MALRVADDGAQDRALRHAVQMQRVDRSRIGRRTATIGNERNAGVLLSKPSNEAILGGFSLLDDDRVIGRRNPLLFRKVRRIELREPGATIAESARCSLGEWLNNASRRGGVLCFARELFVRRGVVFLRVARGTLWSRMGCWQVSGPNREDFPRR